MTAPFAYPPTPLVRRHGPRGYLQPIKYRPWLRDEFAFRCVYCLVREEWGQFFGEFDVEHFLPVAVAPERALEYENLHYACATCNGIKQSRRIPDPAQHLLVDTVTVESDGALNGCTPEAVRIIRVLDLNHPRRIEYRRLWLDLVQLAARHEPSLLKRILGYPALLPDLERLRPPGGNAKPLGLESSYRARRLRGELPDTY